jgi:hypothetical protein
MSDLYRSVRQMYIAVFNITHVSSIIAPRRYAIESIGLVVGTIRSVGWHASQLARSKSIGTQQVNWHGACTRPPTLISSRPVLICSVESTTKHSAYRR